MLLQMRFLLVNYGSIGRQTLLNEIRKNGVWDVVEGSEDCLYMAECNEYDWLFLTNTIKGQAALELCRKLRVNGAEVPIVYLTPYPTSEEKVTFLNSGADIYLSSSAGIDELHAELMVVLRRASTAKADDIVKFKGFNLNLSRRLLFYGEQGVHLSKKEYDLVEHFSLNAGKVLTSELLLEHNWESGLETYSNTLVVHIRNLRMKFKKYTAEEVIETKRGRGYILQA